MRIEVTQKMIDEGIRYKICRCPVALALNAALGERFILVGTCSATIRDSNKKLVFVNLPQEVRDKIVRFDDGRGMIPFSFEIEV